MNPALRAVLLTAPRLPVNQVLTVACGNSISAQSQWAYGGSTGWDMKAELQWANALYGGGMRFGLITASTRCDRYGVYGYGGATLATINADIQAQWIAPVNAGGGPPQLVVGLALLENDIAQGADIPTMQSRLDSWIGTVRGAWPRATILLVTPRPSFSYNTATLVANYQAMRDYTLSKDNGRSIFVARGDSYEDGANPALPLSGYTDASVHPNAKGALTNARAIAATLARMGTKSPGFSSGALNRFLTGSGAASGTNVSGTIPTNCSITGTADAVYVSTADNPGWTMELSTPVAAALQDTGIFNTGEATVSGVTQMSGFVKIQIVSGATNLRAITLEPRVRDGAGLAFRYHLVQADSHVDQEYQDGDVLTFVCPPMAPVSGSFTGSWNYVRPRMKSTTDPVVFKVIETGYYAIQ